MATQVTVAAAAPEQYGTLDELYNELSTRVLRIFEEGASECTDDFIIEIIGLISSCSDMVRREALFSTNEGLEDIATGYLKYLYLDYFLGKMHLQRKDFSARKSHVMDSMFCLNNFLDVCRELNLLDETEQKFLDANESGESLTAENKRAMKIDKFRRNRANQKKMHDLELYISQLKGEHGGDYEDKLRELYLTRLQTYVSEAVDDLDMMQQELVMLSFREREEEAEYQQMHGASHDPRERQKAAEKEAREYANRPGLTVTRTYKENGKLMLDKEFVKATVFGDSIAPPTITLEEFAASEVAAAREREAAQANAPVGPRRYDALLAAGEEDDMALVDDATVEDRAWDKFKEENPKGWGNKAGKRF